MREPSITVVLSGVTSPHRLVESVRIAYGFSGVKVDMFVAVKVSGMASQVGVPEAYRVALRYGKPLVVLSSVKEVFEHFKFDEVYLVVPRFTSGRRLDEIKLEGSKCALVFPGEEPGRGDVPVSVLSVPELPPDAPPQAIIAVTLYHIAKKLEERQLRGDSL